MKAPVCSLLLVVLLLVSFVAPNTIQQQQQQQQQQDNDDDVPFCDEEANKHPSENNNNNNPTEDNINDDNNNNLPNELADNNKPVPNAGHVTNEVTDIVNQITQESAEEGSLNFNKALGKVKQQAAATTERMAGRQQQIEELAKDTLPLVAESVGSRRSRAAVVREHLKDMNKKLVDLVDSLDRSSYVREQQNFMTIVDGLMRIQNAIELQSLNSGTNLRETQTHPTNSLLFQQQQQPKQQQPKQQQQQQQQKSLIPSTTANRIDPDLLDSLHALDLLELSSTTPTTTATKLSHAARKSILIKRVVSLLDTLIRQFTAMRKKHKEFARANREMWGKEVDVLQKQTDSLTSNLEAVLDQGKFYVGSWETHRTELERLVAEQVESQQQLESQQRRMKDLGAEYHESSILRAQQLKTMQQIMHIVSFGNASYSETELKFDCGGVVRGNTTVDACGVCGGDNLTCEDCNGVANGPSRVDICGVCGGDGSACHYFCDGVPNSGNVTDLCGVCGGDGSSCVGCDGIPKSNVLLDSCGVCGGDGSLCSGTAAATTTNKEGNVAIVVELELGMNFSSTWTSQAGVEVSSAVASLTATLPSSVVLLSFAPTTSTVVLSVSVAAEKSQAVLEVLEQSEHNGMLLAAVRANGLVVEFVRLSSAPEIRN